MFKEAVGIKGERLDIVLLGGAVTSLFSLLQVLASPIIGRLSDLYGRRNILLLTMLGNIASALIWTFATSFSLFLLSRVMAGLSEGNVQLSLAMISDITTPETRSRGLALVGIAFALGFTIGPALGAFFASLELSKYYPALQLTGPSFSATAALSLVLLTLETLYIYLYIHETHPGLVQTKNGSVDDQDDQEPLLDQAALLESPKKEALIKRRTKSSKSIKKESSDENDENSGFQPTIALNTLYTAHSFYLFVFSGLEFTLPFLTFDRFRFSTPNQGLYLAFIGLTSSVIQVRVVRPYVNKIGERVLVQVGIMAAFCSLILLGIASTHFDPVALLFKYKISESRDWLDGSSVWPDAPLKHIKGERAPKLYKYSTLLVAGVCFSFASATVVNCMNALVSLAAEKGNKGNNKGEVLGWLRGGGQLGRALGPIFACALYWMFGSIVCYGVEAILMLFPLYLLSA